MLKRLTPVIIAVCAAPLPVLVASPAQAAPVLPTSVSIAGDLNTAMGCSGDWQPDCPQAQLTKGPDDIFRGIYSLPPGAYQYKAAIDSGWTESHGQHGGNDNIPINVGDNPVTFYYDPVSHWATDNLNSQIISAAGTFQLQTGCTGDWAPDCLRTWLQDIDGDGIYTLTITLTPGTYEYKITFSEGWTGAVGKPDGTNLAFTLTEAGTVTITYDSHTGHVTQPPQTPTPNASTPGPTTGASRTGQPATSTAAPTNAVLATTGPQTPLWLALTGCIATVAGLALLLMARRRRDLADPRIGD
jgi:LPXTG-motif cell wall-anchored protein